MPYQWTAERERQMLLLAISSANLRPSAETWTQVAAHLGEGLTPSAVSQKYYKLRNESTKIFDGQPGSTPSTPTKRKASNIDGIHKTPRKKVRSPVKAEDFDGQPFNDSNSNSPDSFKREAAQIPPYPMFHTTTRPQFSPTGYFAEPRIPYNGESSNSSIGTSSFASINTSQTNSFMS